MTEIWKAIDGTDGMIEVSTEGRVRSLLRPSKTILKLQSDAKGYMRVRVTIKRKKMTFKVHREVAKAFIPNPDGKQQVNHIDGNKHNNAADNLEWVTNRENAHHAIKTGLFDAVADAAKRSNDLRKRAVRATESSTGITAVFESVSEAERFFGSRHIVSVLKGRRKHARGWTFEYCEAAAGEVIQ